MKKIFVCFNVLIFSLLSFVSQAASPQVIVSGHGNANVNILDINSGEIVWKFPLQKREFCNSVALLKGGKLIAFTTQLNMKVVNLDKEVVFEYKVEQASKSEIHSVQALKDGGVAVFEASDPSKVIVFDKNFKKVKEFTFAGGNKHQQFRQAIQTSKGTWMIPNFPTKSIIEYNDNGEVLETYPLPTTCFGIKEGLDGMLYLGMGDGHKYAKYDPKTKQIVKEFTTLNGLEFNFVYNAQYQQIGKKLFMVANWTGHRKNPKTLIEPQLLMFDDKDQVLWYWDDTDKDLGKVSAFFYSDKAIVK